MPTYADQVSLNVFSPGIYMAIDSSLSKTGLPIFMQRTVMFGQMGTDAQATAGQVVQIVTENDAKAAFGVDSMLHGMVKVFRKRNPYQTLLVVPLAENVAGNAAAGGITIAGAATKPMTQYFYIGSNIPYQLGVSSGEAAADVAGRLLRRAACQAHGVRRLGARARDRRLGRRARLLHRLLGVAFQRIALGLSRVERLLKSSLGLIEFISRRFDAVQRLGELALEAREAPLHHGRLGNNLGRHGEFRLRLGEVPLELGQFTSG